RSARSRQCGAQRSTERRQARARRGADPTAAQAVVGGRPNAHHQVTIVLSENERADKLHLEGKALLAENKWDEALPKLREAYALKQSYDIASNLAWTLSALEQHVEAARLLCDAKDKLPTVIEPEKRTVFNNVYNDARSRSGIARVEVEGAEDFSVRV